MLLWRSTIGADGARCTVRRAKMLSMLMSPRVDKLLKVGAVNAAHSAVMCSAAIPSKTIALFWRESGPILRLTSYLSEGSGRLPVACAGLCSV